MNSKGSQFQFFKLCVGMSNIISCENINNMKTADLQPDGIIQ